MTLTVVLHDLGDPAAGAPWRDALATHAVGEWDAPDLPGHGTSPPPRSGNYDPMAPVTLARWRVGEHGLDGSLVIGVGENAHPALVLAGGRGCATVAIIDGLHGPWRSDVEEIDEMYARLRRIYTDRSATDPPPSSGLDPRATHGYGVNVTAPFAKVFWGAITAPVLAIETPRSTTPPTERAERVSWFGGPATLVELDDSSPDAVVAAVTAWQHA